MQTEEEYIEEVTQKYRSYITATPRLLSALYDVDLLPEQINKSINALRMAFFCELYKEMETNNASVIFHEQQQHVAVDAAPHGDDTANA